MNVRIIVSPSLPGRVDSRRCGHTDGVDLPILHERPDNSPPPGVGSLLLVDQGLVLASTSALDEDSNG